MTEQSPKVVSLKGAEIIAPYTPRNDVIKEVERVLEMARSGEISGILAVYYHADDCTSGAMQGIRARSMIGMLEILKAGLVEALR